MHAMTGVNTSLTYADKYFGINQSLTHYWTEYFSNNVGYSLSRTEGNPWNLNSASLGLSATMNEAMSVSGNFSQSVPADGYGYTTVSGSLNLNSTAAGNFSPSISSVFTRTVHRQDYTNQSFSQPSVLSYGQNSLNTSLQARLFEKTSTSIDYTTYWYDVAPGSYANSTYVLYINSLDRLGQGDQKIFTMQGIASGATHSSVGISLSHQVFTAMRLALSLSANRGWVQSNWTASQSLSFTFNYDDWSFSPSINRSGFLTPGTTGLESVKYSNSYTISIYRSFR